MKTKVFIAAWLFTVSLAQGQGKEVLIAVGWQGAIKGELIAVKESSLVVAVEDESKISKTVPFTDVQWVVIKAEDYVSTGTTVGALIGGIIGGLVGFNLAGDPASHVWFSECRPVAATGGAVVGALAGGAIGHGIGSAASSKKISVSPADSNFKQVLFPAARNSRGYEWGTR